MGRAVAAHSSGRNRHRRGRQGSSESSALAGDPEALRWFLWPGRRYLRLGKPWHSGSAERRPCERAWGELPQRILRVEIGTGEAAKVRASRARLRTILKRGGWFLWPGRRFLRLEKPWYSGSAEVRPCGRAWGELSQRILRVEIGTGEAAKVRASRARSRTILKRGGWFLWPGRRYLRLGKPWHSGSAEVRPWARVG